MKRNNGFTLIELVIVIVLIGILAATAAPKFLNLKEDAIKSTYKATAGTIKTAFSLFAAKAKIADNVSPSADGADYLNLDLPIEINKKDDFPIFTEDDFEDQIKQLIDLDIPLLKDTDNQLNMTYIFDKNTDGFYIVPNYYGDEERQLKTNCYIHYSARSNKTETSYDKSKIEMNLTDCK